MADTTTPQEAWNMATQTLKRLSRSLDLCSFYSQKGDLVNWFYTSMDLRRNIAPFLTPDEFKVIDDKMKEMPAVWSRQGRVIPKHYSKVHLILDEVYIQFITKMKEKGLLMPKSVDPRSAVLNM